MCSDSSIDGFRPLSPENIILFCKQRHNWACVERQLHEGEGEGEEDSLWNRHKLYSAQNILIYANWRILSIGNWLYFDPSIHGCNAPATSLFACTATNQIHLSILSLYAAIHQPHQISSDKTNAACSCVCAMLTWSVVTETERQTGNTWTHITSDSVTNTQKCEWNDYSLSLCDLMSFSNFIMNLFSCCLFTCNIDSIILLVKGAHRSRRSS